MNEVDEAAKIIADAADQDANIIFGTAIDENLKDQVKITVIATGFDSTKSRLKGFMPAYGGKYNNSNNQSRQQQNNNQPNYPTTNNNQQQPPVPEPEEEKSDEDVWDIPAFLRQKN